MEENIEEVITRIENILNNEKNLKKNRRGNKEIRFEINSLMYNRLKFLISNYKRVLKENEELKAENNKLKVIKYDTNYGTETINLIPKSELVKINTNRYMIEIENGKFVDLKQVYQENEELKEKWDKDTHKLQNDLDIANAKIIELKQELMEG